MLTRITIFYVIDTIEISAVLVLHFYVRVQFCIITEFTVRRVFRVHTAISKLITERKILVGILHFKTNAHTLTPRLFHYTRSVVVVQVKSISEIVSTTVNTNAVLMACHNLVKWLSKPVSVDTLVNV